MIKEIPPPHFGQGGCTAPECARTLLFDFFADDPATAEVLLWEFTCFPMDCVIAAGQAHEIIEDVRCARAMAL